MPSEAGSIQPGPLIAGRFRLEGPLGKGGFGSVYRASDEVLKRVVAIKMLPAPETWLEDDFQSFLREAQILASLEHPHIIRVYDAGRTPDGPFIVMQVAAGPSLSSVCRQGPLSPPVAVRILEQLLEALAFAHARGVIHRDIKPSNVLSENGEHFYLADFGLSSAAGIPSIVPSGAIAGTLAYMAPECFRGAVSFKSDIFSVGVLAYRLLFGRDCFNASTDHILRATSWKPPSFEDSPAGLPQALPALLTSMLSADPGRRPTAAEACKILRTVNTHGPEGTVSDELTVSLTGGFPAPQKPATPSSKDSVLSLGEAVFSLERLADGLEATLASGRPPDADFLEKFSRLRDGCEGIVALLTRKSVTPSDSLEEPLEFARAIIDEASRSVLSLLDRVTATLRGHSARIAGTGLVSEILALQLHRIIIPKLANLPREGGEAVDSSGGFFFDQGEAGDGPNPSAFDIREGLLSVDELRQIDTFLSLSDHSSSSLFRVLGSASAEDREKLLHALWTRCDLLLLRMRSASRAFLESIDFLTSDPALRKKWKLMYALFRKAAGGAFWSIDMARATLDELTPADRLVFARSFLLHPDEGFRQYALEVLNPADAWDYILDESTSLSRLFDLWAAFQGKVSTGFRKVFFVSTRQRIAGPPSAAEAGAAFSLLKSFYQLPFFHEDSYFHMLEQVQESLQERAASFGLGQDPDSEYVALMRAFLSAPRSRDFPVEDWSTVPLAIQRRIARKGHFLRHFVCHPVDPIALECLPHLLKLENVAPYVSIFSINSRVIIELSRDRRLFQTEEARMALASNPKTPASVVVQYISFLRRDNLRRLSESHEGNQFARQFAIKLLARNV